MEENETELVALFNYQSNYLLSKTLSKPLMKSKMTQRLHWRRTTILVIIVPVDEFKPAER